ncbi:hypothetical protein ACFPRL_09220 [Pseudoclavibacter helvolus]
MQRCHLRRARRRGRGRSPASTSIARRTPSRRRPRSRTHHSGTVARGSLTSAAAQGCRDDRRIAVRGVRWEAAALDIAPATRERPPRASPG